MIWVVVALVLLYVGVRRYGSARLSTTTTAAESTSSSPSIDPREITIARMLRLDTRRCHPQVRRALRTGDMGPLALIAQRRLQNDAHAYHRFHDWIESWSSSSSSVGHPRASDPWLDHTSFAFVTSRKKDANTTASVNPLAESTRIKKEEDDDKDDM